MTKNHKLEFFLGVFVLVLTSLFFVFMYSSRSSNVSTGHYMVEARFESADGLMKGSDVKIAGIVVGTIDDLWLDTKYFNAVVKISIKDTILVPKDSSATITNSGLLGSKYIAIIPGGDADNLKNGDMIDKTDAGISLEKIIGKLMYSFSQKNSDNSK